LDKEFKYKLAEMLAQYLEVRVEFHKSQAYYDFDTITTYVYFDGELVSKTETMTSL
jgi:hypothetical protein